MQDATEDGVPALDQHRPSPMIPRKALQRVVQEMARGCKASVLRERFRPVGSAARHY